jgi:FkbM family methyltransferase
MRVGEAVRAAARLLVLDEKSVSIVRWRLRRGDATLRLDYDLRPDSLVYDVGGYRGEWAQAIAARYDCRIEVFEPLQAYCEVISGVLRGNPKVKLHPFGLAGATGRHLISVDEEASSHVKVAGKTEEIQLVDIAEHLERQGVRAIDLIKVNIEGGEFELLGRMHEKDLLRACRDIQIQFHDFVPDARRRREELRGILSRTHRLTYDFPFIWENWRRKEGAE